MEAPLPHLRILDRTGAAPELDLVSELFHRINRIVPRNQHLLTVGPDLPARDAISIMRTHGYSQVPVVSNGKVLGIFSFRSFAHECAKLTFDDLKSDKEAPADLQVGDFVEQFHYARVTEEMTRVFDAMDRDNGVLIGTDENLIGILTPMDFLRYLHQVASPFVMVSEIELALRALIRLAMTADELASAAQRCLAKAYSDRTVPESLEEMSFADYQSLIQARDNWPSFKSVFGGTRIATSGKLKQVGSIRNDVFHFKREITLGDHEILAGHRDWLLTKVRQAEARSGYEDAL